MPFAHALKLMDMFEDLRFRDEQNGTKGTEN
jgi:hypothetical protein